MEGGGEGRGERKGGTRWREEGREEGRGGGGREGGGRKEGGGPLVVFIRAGLIQCNNCPKRGGQLQGGRRERWDVGGRDGGKDGR